jgi:DNA-binding transcriptional LysR family regulator
MQVNLEYYRVFYHAAKFKSITLAAKELCISQPAASQAIKHLENALGGSLFFRTSKGLKLTKEGIVLFSYVEKGYDTIKLGEERFKNLLNLDLGEIIIGASDMTLQFYLLPYLEKYHEKYPGIKIKVTNATTPETLLNLEEGKIDFGIITTPFNMNKNINSIDVMKIKTIFIGGMEYKNYKGKKLKLQTIKDMPLICLEKNTSTRMASDLFLKKHNITIFPEFELATSDMIVQFVKRNLGIGMVASGFAQKYIEEGSVFELHFEEEMEERNISIVSHQNNHISSAGEELLSMLIS